MIMFVFYEYCIWKYELCYDSLYLFGDEIVIVWVVVIFNFVFVFSMIDMVIFFFVIFYVMEILIKFVEDYGYFWFIILVRILFNYLELKNYFNVCYNLWEMWWVVWYGYWLVEFLLLLINDWILFVYLFIYSVKVYINEFRLYVLYKVFVNVLFILFNLKIRNV